MISKTRYVEYKDCKKSLWLSFHKPNEAAPMNEVLIGALEDGNLVGELAKTCFKGLVDCSRKLLDGISYSEQIKATKEALKQNASAIAEASFQFEDLFCAVDILVKEDGGYSIYEVKSSKELKDYYITDASFQKYVLEKCGITVLHTNIVHVNRDYILSGKLNPMEYFLVEDIDAEVEERIKDIESDIEDIHNMLSQEEPRVPFCHNCKDCLYEAYCTKELPKDRIGTLNGVGTKQYDFYNEGIFTIEDYVTTKDYQKCKNKRRLIQIEHNLHSIEEPHIDKDAIKRFLEQIQYPIYYLDFETASFIIPEVLGFHPGEAFPFQYSLHIEYEDGTIEHKEYLADKKDCTRELAEHLIHDIPKDANIIAYNKSVESNVIKNLGKRYPDLSAHLNNLSGNFIDLLDVFKNGDYYNPKQAGSNSIKAVMPAIVPYMASAYHDLPVVHNGGEALTMFHTLIATKDIKEHERIRRGMLDYCKLDTLSMVEIIKELRKLIK